MLSSPAPALRVLVLDGEHRQALVAVRSLGRRRARVAVASAVPNVAAAASRFCADRVQAPDPCDDVATYLQWLRDRMQRHRDDVLLSFGASTTRILSKHRHALGTGAGCALPEPALLRACAEPGATAALAAEIGLDAATQPPGRGLPDALQQDYVLLALLRRGDPIATFVYRLHALEAEGHLPWFERSASESADQPTVRRLGLEPLTRRRWHGVAVVGFRHDVHRDRLALLGLHPTWTDGMELAIACGIDMPWLYAQLAAGRPITGPTFYPVGRKRRRAFSPLRLLHAPAPQRLTSLRPDSSTDLFFRDPLPHLPTVERATAWLRRHLGRRPLASTPCRPRLRLVVGSGRGPDDTSDS